jgi:nitronate monooxygenase
MAGGPSTPALAAAVANCGGLGFLAGGLLTAEELADEITATRRLTSGAIGVNLFVGEPFRDDGEWAAKLGVVCDLRPEVVSFTFGAPNSGECRRITGAGILALATVTSLGEARIALSCGVDGVVAQGREAGGHRATFDPLAVPADDPLDALVDRLIGRLACPVLAAGGIATASDVRRVRCIGATAAQIGTALLRSDEAGTNRVHRAALRDPQFEQTVMTRAFTGRYARALRNRFIDQHEQDAVHGFPEVARITAPLQAAALKAGDPHGISLWAGTAFRHAKTGSAVDIVRELAA